MGGIASKHRQLRHVFQSLLTIHEHRLGKPVHEVLKPLKATYEGPIHLPSEFWGIHPVFDDGILAHFEADEAQNDANDAASFFFEAFFDANYANDARVLVNLLVLRKGYYFGAVPGNFTDTLFEV